MFMNQEFQNPINFPERFRRAEELFHKSEFNKSKSIIEDFLVGLNGDSIQVTSETLWYQYRSYCALAEIELINNEEDYAREHLENAFQIFQKIVTEFPERNLTKEEFKEQSKTFYSDKKEELDKLIDEIFNK